MAKKIVEILMGLAIILSMFSLISECKKEELTDAVNDNWHISFGKFLLSIDAHLDGKSNEYQKYISEVNVLLQRFIKINEDRHLYTIITYYTAIGALISNMVAFILLIKY